VSTDQPRQDVPAVSAHPGAQTFLPPVAPAGLPTVGVPVVVDGLDGGDD